MGTLRIQRLSDAVICQLYRDGWSRHDIGLRAKRCDHEVVAILRTHSVTIRNTVEGQTVARERRQRSVGKSRSERGVRG